MATKKSIGEELRRLREKAGLDQRQLAIKIGCSQPHISNVETGESKPSDELVERYRKACGA